MLYAVSDFVELLPGEEPFKESVRFRTVGDMSCTGAVASEAKTLTTWSPRSRPPASPSAARRAPTTASPRPPWRTARRRATSSDGHSRRSDQRKAHGRSHLGARPVRNRGLGRRRQVDADRPAAVRHQVDLRGPARARRGDLEAARRRLREPRAPDRRPARRARAGHHDRRRVPLLRHAAAQVHHRRHARPRAVHAQHGHGRLDGRPGAGPGRRAQGRARAVAPPRVHRVAPAHPAPGRLRQQDGPGRLGPGGLRPHRRGLHGLGGEARHPGRDLHPGLGAARRQRGRSVREHALVPGAVAALPPRARPRGLRSQPPGRALPGAVGHAPDVGRAARLPRLRGRGGLGRLPQGRRGRRAALGGAPAGSRESTPSTARSKRPTRRCRSRCGSRTTSTSRAAT